MNIEINTDFLTDKKISADDYLYLYILQRNGDKYLQTLTLKPNIDSMLEQGYLELSEDHYIVTTKYTDFFSNNFTVMFAELIDTYPWKVKSPNRGIRILHAKDSAAKANDKAKNKYKRITKVKQDVHEHIIKCLKIQLEVEKDSLGYMQNLETWLNNHTWEKYEDINYDDTKSTEETQRITRQL